MSIQFLPGKLKGDERKTIIEAVQKELQAAAIEAIKPLLTQFCEEEVSVKLGRQKGEARRVSAPVRESEWQCGSCGCRDANQFTRDGQYRRALETGWGHMQGLQVPMLECQCCGHDVICTYTILEKYQRFWLDRDQQVLFGTGLCQSLRSLSQQWSATLGGSVGLGTLNERLNQIAPLVSHARTEPLREAPPIVQFDGIWLRLQTPTDTIKQDTRHRQRKQHVGKKVVLLVALGFWTDGSGRREILDWQRADGESKAAWEPFVHRLWERGLRPERGLQAVIRDGCGEMGEAIAWVYGTTVIEQRCIFHKLRNVGDKCREELKGEPQKETRKQFMEQATAIYQAESAEQARLRLAALIDTWQAQCPKTVATCVRDFEQTIAYFALDGVARELIRTTSLLERTNPELRRKFRQVCCFGSPTGAEVSIFLQVKRLNARWSHQTWWEASHSLYFDFLDLDP